MVLRVGVIAAAAAIVGWLVLGAPGLTETLSHGRFRHVRIFQPSGEVRHFVLFLSGDGGWNSRLSAIARSMASNETLVAGIDTAELFETLEKDGGRCVFPDGDLENLSRYIQAYYKLPAYFTPILVGHSAGATLAYAVLAQAPAGSFSGALSMSFCTDLDLRKPLCKTRDLDFAPSPDGEGFRMAPPQNLHAPWIAIHGSGDDVCPASEARNFVARINGARYVEIAGLDHNYANMRLWWPQFARAFETLLASEPRSQALPQGLSDLPIIEVPATGGSDTFAVFLSGDGGWAGLDKQVAAVLAARGIPVAGLDSLRYFWTARTPAGVAADVDRMLRYYAAHWGRKRAILLGFSQGADVLPFVVNRLPAASRSLVELTALIGVSEQASFEFHVSNWLWSGHDDLAVAGEMARLSAADTLCLYGEGDAESICPKVAATNARSIKLGAGHHFGGDYEGLAKLIIAQAPGG